MTAPLLDVHGILRKLPHRYPFLLVDRAVDYIRAPNAKPGPLEFVIDATIERRNLLLPFRSTAGKLTWRACEAGFGII